MLIFLYCNTILLVIILINHIVILQVSILFQIIGIFLSPFLFFLFFFCTIFLHCEFLVSLYEFIMVLFK